MSIKRVTDRWEVRTSQICFPRSEGRPRLHTCLCVIGQPIYDVRTEGRWGCLKMDAELHYLHLNDTSTQGGGSKLWNSVGIIYGWSPLRVPVPAPHTRMKYAIIFGNMHIISQSQVRNGTDHRAIEAMYVVHHCLFYCSFENTWGVCINVSENINNHGV